MKRIKSICTQIKGILPDDFDKAFKMAYEQTEYIHPLKNAKATRLNRMGKQNIKILDTLKKLQSLIIQNAPIK